MSETHIHPTPSKWQPVLTGLAWLVGLVLIYLALKYVVPYFMPFLVALVLAVLIDPTVNGLEERLHLPRGIAVAITLVFFLGLVVGLALFGVGAIVVQLGQLAADLPAQYDRLVSFSESLLARATTVFRGLPPDFVSLTENTIRSSLGSVYAGVQNLVRTVLGGLAGLPSVVLVAVISLVGTFFFSRDKQLIGNFLLSLLPVGYRERVVRANRDVVSSAVGLVKAQLTLVAITLVIIVVGLFVLGVRYAWLVGLVAGLLDVLPAVGPATVLVPWAVYCFIEGNPGLGAGLLVLVGIVTVFRQIMEPRIIGQRIGLHPLLTLLALYLGLKLLGAAGIIVGPLVAITVKAVIRSGRVPPRPPRLRGPRPRGGRPAP
jgi:sporulation integral membrane protein YtvI